MLAAEEMGTKGVRAMTPLETTLANALRVKLGKGRDLPEEPKPKRPARAKTAAPAQGDAEGELTKVAHPRKRSEEHTSELQSQSNLVCRLLLEKKKQTSCAHGTS